MELKECIDKRRSIRSFKDKDVDEETVKELIEKANMAPSAGNQQARDFIVIRDEGKKKEIAGACLGQGYVAKAPVLIIICANKNRSGNKYGERGKELYSIVDASLSAQNLMLSAVEKGLGTVYVGAFDEARVSHSINAPEHVKPIGIIPIGYPDEEGEDTGRFRADKLIHRGSF